MLRPFGRMHNRSDGCLLSWFLLAYLPTVGTVWSSVRTDSVIVDFNLSDRPDGSTAESNGLLSSPTVRTAWLPVPTVALVFVSL